MWMTVCTIIYFFLYPPSPTCLWSLTQQLKTCLPASLPLWPRNTSWFNRLAECKERWFVVRFHMLLTFSREEQQHILIFPSSSAATCRLSPRPGSVILLCFAKWNLCYSVIRLPFWSGASLSRLIWLCFKKSAHGLLCVAGGPVYLKWARIAF